MKVKFVPQNIEIPISPEKTLLQAALENNVEISSICKGKLICAECRVKVVSGESNLLPPSKAELNLIGTSWQLESRRLACQVRCFGDVTIDLSEQVKSEEAARKNIRGFKSSRSISESKAVIDTMILNERIEVAPETAGDASAPPASNRQQARKKGGGGEGGGQRQGEGRGGNRGGRGGGRNKGRGPKDTTQS
ncbi:MAG: 2Fe-2S iron-sulfur cluster binding domain-containing protein [Bdellovibrionaceae bacterium]|nr:2Fe-2S iron-sulfur cluster binding domain-containing protein [Pseudobdellovibrionaceae bacterium]